MYYCELWWLDCIIKDMNGWSYSQMCLSASLCVEKIPFTNISLILIAFLKTHTQSTAQLFLKLLVSVLEFVWVSSITIAKSVCVILFDHTILLGKISRYSSHQCCEGYFGNAIAYRLQVTLYKMKCNYFNYFIEVMYLITFDYLITKFFFFSFFFLNC